MANSKRKCGFCGDRFKTETMVIKGAQAFCSNDHWIENQVKNKDKLIAKGQKMQKTAKRKEEKASKDESKENRRKLREFNQKDLRWQHKQTQPVFNKMRVLEELLHFQNEGVEPVCISCGKPLGGDQWCCGHFKTVGAQGRLRYDAKNTFLQHNRSCNMGLSGDIAGTKNTHGYLEGLKIRFGEAGGQSIIDYCETNQDACKWTWQEVEAIRTKCRARIRELEGLLCQ